MVERIQDMPPGTVLFEPGEVEIYGLDGLADAERWVSL